MSAHLKEIIIYVPLDTAVIIVTSEPNPEFKEDDHWEDELQQMLDDYD